MPVTTPTRTLQVPLPEGATDEDLEALRAVVQTAVAVHFERNPAWAAVQRRLEEDGWTVSFRLAWCAEARRGRDLERAVGGDRDEALRELEKLTCLDWPGGGP